MKSRGNTALKRDIKMWEKMVSLPASEACKLNPYGENDPVTVTCGGGKTRWVSRHAAMSYFLYGVGMCEGSEAERYSTIVNLLRLGISDVTDSYDHPTEEMEKVFRFLARRNPAKRAKRAS